MRNLKAATCLTLAVRSLAFFLAPPLGDVGESNWFGKTISAGGLGHRFVVTLPAYISGAETITLTQPSGEGKFMGLSVVASLYGSQLGLMTLTNSVPHNKAC